MPGSQFSHFRDKMSLARDTGNRGSIPGRSRPFRDGWQPYFAELVLYIEETRQDEETAPVFRLADLVQLYQSRMEQLGVQLDTRVHSTRLKQRPLAQFPDMRAHTKGRDILMAFEEDVGAALAKACELDSDSDAVHLAHAAQIVRRHMFGEAKPFTGFPEGCQGESVPPLLLAIVSMNLEGPSIKEQMADKLSYVR